MLIVRSAGVMDASQEWIIRSAGSTSGGLEAIARITVRGRGVNTGPLNGVISISEVTGGTES